MENFSKCRLLFTKIDKIFRPAKPFFRELTNFSTTLWVWVGLRPTAPILGCFSPC
jgi:hypothetical protein